MKTKVAKSGLALLRALPFLAVPMMVGAQADFEGFLAQVQDWINTLVPIIIGISLVFFLYGLARFVFATAQGDENARERGRQIILYGIIALFVSVAVWGILNFILDTFGLSDELVEPPEVPQAPGT